jgi:transposase InsO family protein
MASKGLPVVLAVEIEASRAAASAARSRASHRGDGDSESNLGRGTDRFGTPAQAGDPRVSSNGEALHTHRCSVQEGARSQTWSTFVRNHASAVIASDFFVAITATFRVLYVFLVLDVGTRRIRHWNATAHPTAEWTAQQFRMVVSGDAPHRFVIHDRDSISEGVDRTIKAMGLTVLKTPVRSPQANAFCERLIGTIRRECLDWMIPLNEEHLRRVLRRWVVHYNRGRPHASLGPDIPDRPGNDLTPLSYGHRDRDGHRVTVEPILSGLHHEYRLEPLAA